MTASFGDNYRKELNCLPSLYLSVIEGCLFILYLIHTSSYSVRPPCGVCCWSAFVKQN